MAVATHFLLRWDFGGESRFPKFLYIYRQWKDFRVQKACGTKNS